MNRKYGIRKGLVFLLILLCLLAAVLPGCGSEQNAQVRQYTKLSDFNGGVMGTRTGAPYDVMMAEDYQGLEWKYFDDLSTGLVALKKGDIDCYVSSTPVNMLTCAKFPDDFALFPENVVSTQYGMMLKKGSALVEPVSKAILDMKADGTLEALQEKWLSGDEQKMQIDWSQYDMSDKGNGTLQAYFDTNQMPLCYIGADGKGCGFELEVALMVAERMNMGIEFHDSVQPTVMMYVQSGKADLGISCFTITPERLETVDFCEPYFNGGVTILCRKANLQEVTGNQVTGEKAGFFENLKVNFEKTFIRESRWKLIVGGLITTLEISVLAGILGTVLGFGLCLLRRTKVKAAAAIAAGFCKLMQGIPSLVVLMIANFVVFGQVSIPPVLVGIFSFSLLFAVSVSSILSTGINTIDKGQWEAATSLGFGKAQTFLKIIMPQAVRSVLPLYKGEFVSMMKLTSIVGYISIQDLTKASDIIRSRTYEAFFPLISTAVIYFLLSNLITFLLGRVEVKIDPKHRARKLPKGIDPEVHTLPEAVEEEKQQQSKEPIIRLQHLKKVYPNITPLKDVNADIVPGEVITIIGPSGTGKSTLMRCINRLEIPTDGKVTVFGEDMGDKNTDLLKLRRRMGMVFQSFNLFGHLTIIENIILAPTLLKGVSRQQAYERGMQLLRTVGLAEKALNYPDELSGGQKQRVAIARTLAMDPEIIFFDEPTSALDPTMVGEVLAVIRSLAKKGLTMMIVTHEMKFARDVSTRIFYMDQGLIYEDGTPQQIFDDPQKERTRQFIRRLKVLEINADSPNFDFIGTINEMEKFGRKHYIGQKTIFRMQTVFEEICTQLFKPEQEVELHLLVEYSEQTGNTDMTFRYTGPDFDPAADGDPISAALIKGSCQRYEYGSAEDGTANKLSLTLKD